MWTYVIVNCEYWEYDSSRYRLAMSQQTLIESLKRQTDKSFSLIVRNSAMDPMYTRRLLSFDTIDVPWYLDGELDFEVPRRHIEVPDDVFLLPNFISGLKGFGSERNIRFNMKQGLVFDGGKVQRWTSEIEHVKVQQITNGEPVTEDLPGQWILPIHQMNDDMNGTVGEEASFNCDGWRAEIISKIAETQIVTGSALGCDLHPDRSSSMIKGYKHYLNRGKVRRGGTIMSTEKKDSLVDHGGRSRGNRLRCRRRKSKKN